MIESLAKGRLSTFIHSATRGAGLRNILSNTAWLFIDNVLSVLAGFLVGAWVARYLGPTQYGIYNYALAIVALFAPLVALGLKDIVVRDIVRAPKDKDEILGTTFGLQLAGGVFALGLSVGIAALTRSDSALTRGLIVILASQFVFQAFSVTVGYWFNSQVQSKYVVWANNAALLLYSLVRIGLVLSAAPLTAFAWAALGQAIVYAAGMAVFHHISGHMLSSWRVSLARARHLLADSWPLLISALAIMVYMKIGQVMLGNMVDDRTLGIYSVAVRLTELWYFVSAAIAVSVFPALVRSHEADSYEVHRKRMQLYYDVISGIAYTIVIPLTLLAPFVVGTLFGAPYAEAGPILRVYAWALLFVFLGVARSRWLIAENMVRFSMLATMLGALTNIGMNFILIPRLGGLGAAWAVVISQAVSTYLTSLLSRRLWPVFGQQSLALVIPFRVVSLKRSLGAILEELSSSEGTSASS